MPGEMEEEHDVEYSSGCESGWTMYLNQSYCSRSFSLSDKKVGFGWEGSGEEEKEEDMSMLSDASSGPPHVHEDYGFCQGKSEFGSASSAAFAREGDYSSRSRRSPRKEKECLQWMDDTASSHAYSFSKPNKEKFQLENRSSSINREETVENVMEFSMDFSSTHSRSKSSRDKQYRFFQRALPGKASPISPVCREENRNKIR